MFLSTVRNNIVLRHIFTKMVEILQTTFSNYFSSKFLYWFNFSLKFVHKDWQYSIAGPNTPLSEPMMALISLGRTRHYLNQWWHILPVCVCQSVSLIWLLYHIFYWCGTSFFPNIILWWLGISFQPKEWLFFPTEFTEKKFFFKLICDKICSITTKVYEWYDISFFTISPIWLGNHEKMVEFTVATCFMAPMPECLKASIINYLSSISNKHMQSHWTKS